VVRDGRTGSIHLLSPFASQVFTTLLTSSAWSFSDLGKHCLGETADLAPLEEVLAAFQKLGLAEFEQP
jgi:hypothetical protein